MSEAGCPHPGAPRACPLCAIGEGFTDEGQSALDRLSDLMASGLLENAYGPAVRDDLAYARDCVLGREWELAFTRQHQKLIDDGKIDPVTGRVL